MPPEPRRPGGFLFALVLSGLLAGCAVAPRQATAPPPVQALPVPTPALVPIPAATPTPAPAAPPAGVVETPRRADVSPSTVRVLLQTGAGAAFPEPGRRYVAAVGGRVVEIRGPLEVIGQPRPVAMQVGAFARADNGQALTDRLRAAGIRAELQSSGEVARVVALGRDGESEEALGARLRSAGVKEWSRATVAVRAGIVVRGEGGQSVGGEEVRLVPVDPEPVRVGAKRVRGEFVVRAGVEGAAVVNLVGLEAYLKGVVPAELGPKAFPALEALKAQAVAARTYAIAHLGEHEAEGYDICDSTLCQVYGGADAEHPLSDQAVAETAGEVALFDGRPIDAMYHSTCAGHTEDAAAVFPERAAPYLKGVPCMGDREVAVGGGVSPSAWFGSVERLARVGEAAAARLDVKPDPASLARALGGGEPGAGAVGLGRAFSAGGAGVLFGEGAPELTEARLLELLRTFRLPLPEPGRGVSKARWELALVVRLAQLDGRLEAATGRMAPGPTGAQLVVDGGESVRPVGSNVPAFERSLDRFRAGPVRASAGSPATGWYLDETCLAVEVEPLRRADDRSAWAWWVRELPLDEIGRKLGLGGVGGIAVTRRGVSGRALQVRVEAAAGGKDVNAYAFRRALGLPDTLFTVTVRQGPKGRVARFLGRGWGHGVGMCQNGAYGLALGGTSYREILATYYAGVTVARWDGLDRGGNP
ncbi:MAG: SpoIID/LytB domain-containing protein [Acidobacteria bacterium]|nr:SpoIID/LytB domain-containing protein [Acidobacteriota bacterium]